MLTEGRDLERSRRTWDLVGNVELRGFFGRNRNDGVWRRRFVPKHFSNVFFCRLGVFVTGVRFAWSQLEGGQSWLLQVLAAEMLTRRGSLNRSGSKWDLVGNVGLRGFSGGKWWDAASGIGMRGFVPARHWLAEGGRFRLIIPFWSLGRRAAFRAERRHELPVLFCGGEERFGRVLTRPETLFTHAAHSAQAQLHLAKFLVRKQEF
jgi:hypothetical protein